MMDNVFKNSVVKTTENCHPYLTNAILRVATYSPVRIPYR